MTINSASDRNENENKCVLWGKGAIRMNSSLTNFQIPLWLQRITFANSFLRLFFAS
jgi:hypothetical protein